MEHNRIFNATCLSEFVYNTTINFPSTIQNCFLTAKLVLNLLLWWPRGAKWALCACAALLGKKSFQLLNKQVLMILNNNHHDTFQELSDPYLHTDYPSRRISYKRIKNIFMSVVYSGLKNIIEACFTIFLLNITFYNVK